MRWRSRTLAAIWAMFAIGTCLLLQHIWFVETPLQPGALFLPCSEAYFLPQKQHAGSDGGVPDFQQVYHYLWNPDHTEELLQAPGVEKVVLEAIEPVPFPPTQMVDYIVVDDIAIKPAEMDDPVKGPILARVLQDAAQIEWRLLWQRALTGTAAWAAVLAAMGLITWRMTKRARSKKREQR